MQSKLISRKKFSSLLAYSTLYFDMANVSRMRALYEPKTAKLAEMREEFCIFESIAPGLKANFYEPYVDMSTVDESTSIFKPLRSSSSRMQRELPNGVEFETVIVLNTQSQEICGHVVLMRISTSRRREEEREADATWRC